MRRKIAINVGTTLLGCALVYLALTLPFVTIEDREPVRHPEQDAAIEALEAKADIARKADDQAKERTLSIPVPFAETILPPQW